MNECKNLTTFSLFSIIELEDKKQKQKMYSKTNKKPYFNPFSGIILCLVIILCSGFVNWGFLNISTAHAAGTTYKAQRIQQSYPGIINAQAGKAFTFWVKYKNVGTATWYNSGNNLVAINNSNPYGRKSPFQHQWWPTWYCPARLLETSVKPGEVGTFRFAMQAPEIPGLYSEKFQLAIKNIDWMTGGNVEVVIRVEIRITKVYLFLQLIKKGLPKNHLQKIHSLKFPFHKRKRKLQKKPCPNLILRDMQ